MLDLWFANIYISDYIITIFHISNSLTTIYQYICKLQIWTRESQAACLAHEKHVQIIGNSEIYFTILIHFYHHIVALRCVAARACAKQSAPSLELRDTKEKGNSTAWGNPTT